MTTNVPEQFSADQQKSDKTSAHQMHKMFAFQNKQGGEQEKGEQEKAAHKKTVMPMQMVQPFLPAATLTLDPAPVMMEGAKLPAPVSRRNPYDDKYADDRYHYPMPRQHSHPYVRPGANQKHRAKPDDFDC
jgi:hypothetical protein